MNAPLSNPTSATSGVTGVLAAADALNAHKDAIDAIREYCDDAADLGSSSVYIEVIESILKRHGLR